MNIAELKVGQGNVDLEADVTEISEVRSFNKFGRDLKVATATLKDSSGSIKLSLWNQDIDKVKLGDRIKVSNGYVNEFQGEKQLTAGKLGKIEVIGKAESSAGGEVKKEAESGEIEPVEEVEEEDEFEEQEVEEGEGF